MGLISRVSSRTYRILIWADLSNQGVLLSSLPADMLVKRRQSSKNRTTVPERGCTAMLWSLVSIGAQGKLPSRWARKHRQEEQDEAIRESCQLQSPPCHQVLFDIPINKESVNKEALKDATSKRKARSHVKQVMEDRYKTGKNPWFFQKLRF